MQINAHRLEGRQVKQLSCPKNQTPMAQGMPDTIVLHYTAGKNGESSARYLARDHVKASAHLVVARDGAIYQLVPFNTVAWHAGRSSWKGRSGLNQYSIGIEIDNAGVLTRAGSQYAAWFGRKYSPDEVIQATHRNEDNPRHWHTYTEQQIEVVETLCEMLTDRYPAIKEIVGHEEIARGRKQDPGPAFPLDELRHRIFNDRDTDEPEPAAPARTGTVTVPFLNVRAQPHKSAPQAGPPLPMGAAVKIIDKENGWYKIETRQQGWIAAQYVQNDFKNLPL